MLRKELHCQGRLLIPTSLLTVTSKALPVLLCFKLLSLGGHAWGRGGLSEQNTFPDQILQATLCTSTWGLPCHPKEKNV